MELSIEHSYFYWKNKPRLLTQQLEKGYSDSEKFISHDEASIRPKQSCRKPGPRWKKTPLYNVRNWEAARRSH